MRRKQNPLRSLSLFLLMGLTVSTGMLTKGAVELIRHRGEAVEAVLVAMNASLPGVESRDLDHLHPRFRTQVLSIIDDLESGGHEALIGSTWRSPTRQKTIYAASLMGNLLGQAPGTQAGPGQSCHNQEVAGSPASAAIDIRPGGSLTREEQAAFYKALGAAAHARGLRWGGDWSRKNPVWARYDLGWDPAHVEARSLCRSLRGKRNS